MNTQGPTAVIAGNLIDGTGRPAMKNAGVVVVDGSIRRVGPAEQIRQEAQAHGGEVIEAGSGTLLPGLIDGHVHVSWGRDNAPGWAECRDDQRLLMAWSINAAQRALAAGITTLGDCGAPFGITVPLRRAAAAGVLTAPNLFVCGPCITTTGGHGEFIGVTADNADELRSRVRALCRDGVDFIKIMATGGSADQETNRRRAQYSVEELSAAVADAHRLRRRVVAHCNATEGIRNAVEAGVDIIAHCNWLGEADGTLEYDPAVATNMASQGVYVDLNLTGATAPIGPRDGRLPGREESAQPVDRWDLLSELRAAGGPVYFTSDLFGPAIGDRFPGLVAQAAGKWGLCAEEMVWRTTGLPATGLGIESTRGTLEPGKLADLLVVEGDLGADLAALTRPQFVFREGRLVVCEGRLTAA